MIFDCISAGISRVLLFVEKDSWCQQQPSSPPEQEAAVAASHPKLSQHAGWPAKGGGFQLTSRYQYLQHLIVRELLCRKRNFPCNWNYSWG